MSSYSQPRMLTFKASEAISKYLFVIQTADEIVEQCDGAGEKMIGISMSETSEADQAIEVAIQGGGAKITLGGTVARGDLIKTDANGKGVVSSTNLDVYGARAMASGVVGDIIPVEVIYGTLSVA